MGLIECKEICKRFGEKVHPDLKVKVVDTDFLESAVRVMNFYVARCGDGQIALADLVAFGQVGVKIRFSEEQRFRTNTAI